MRETYPWKKAIEYLETAERFQLPDLKDLCGEELAISLDEDNVGELLVWATNYNAGSLKNRSPNVKGTLNFARWHSFRVTDHSFGP